MTETAPILHYNEQRGTVEVAVFRSAARAVAAEWVHDALLLSALATLLSASAAFGAAYLVTRPMRRLMEGAARWQEPDAADLFPLSGCKEMVQLSIALQEMRARALAFQRELSAAVAARTRELTDAYAALEESFYQTAAALAQALDAKDPYTATHASRTAALVAAIARRLGLPADVQKTCALAANLHDIGKIGVPEAVLLKAGPLTAAERATMQQHAAIGAHILAQARGMANVALLVRHHHERWDGTGYPDGLAGEQIPLGSRIIAIADALEAMCSERPYRGPLSPPAALAEIRRGAGTQFDPALLAAVWEDLERAAAQWCSGRGPG